MRKILAFIWDTLKIVIISLAIIIPVRYYLVQPFFVRGASMRPNFDNGQYLVIDEISYRFESPKRGEVIVFRYPLDPSQFYIKRIIGLPNETVEVKGGRVFVYSESGQRILLDESFYLPQDIITPGNFKIELGPDQYFVLGDNRRASSDSRNWGALEKKFIVGRVWLRIWPFDIAKVF